MRIGHEQMAHDPCRFGPFLLVAADAEQVHEPVQVGLEVVLLHPGEAEEVAPEPRAQVVHELHRFQVRRVLRIRLVRLVGALGGLHEAFVGLLLVVVDELTGRYVRQQRVPDALRGGLAVAAYDYDGILEGVGHGESPSPR